MHLFVVNMVYFKGVWCLHHYQHGCCL